ncbi:MAG: hypothetical protein H5T34_02715 [Candidatus Methanomethyliales bacterium]|nr:hypothetical protein [Candidatus Methanomethylicales archaeon]
MVLDRIALLYQSNAAILRALGQDEGAQGMLHEAEDLQRDLETPHPLAK